MLSFEDELIVIENGVLCQCKKKNLLTLSVPDETEAIADGVAIAAFERFNNEFAVAGIFIGTNIFDGGPFNFDQLKIPPSKNNSVLNESF